MHHSPLRYPGGKSTLSKFIQDLVEKSSLRGAVYYELYAGGAGAGLKLLYNSTFDRIVLNDADLHIYAFWKSILERNSEFIKKINNTDVNIDNWHKQKEIYINPESYNYLDIGFSTFFLNRCNRSGILHKAGPIGGIQQQGKYLIDARFNKPNLIQRIEKIGKWKEKISIYQREAVNFLIDIFEQNHNENKFIFLDPPYYDQGENLYLNYYDHEDHERLASLLKLNRNQDWFLSYDNKNEIIELYSELRKSTYSTRYSLQDKKKASEILIFSDSLDIPKNFRIHSRKLTFETSRT